MCFIVWVWFWRAHDYWIHNGSEVVRVGIAWRLHLRWSATTPPMVLGIFLSTFLVLASDFGYFLFVCDARICDIGCWRSWLIFGYGSVISVYGVIILSDLNVLT